MDNAIERQTALTLLEEGVKAPVRAPLLFRIFKKKTIQLVITPPSQGTLHRIAKLSLKHRMSFNDINTLKQADANILFLRYGWAFSQVVAVAWLNAYLRGKLFTKIVAWYLYWHMDNFQLLKIAQVVEALGSKEAFTNTIILVTGTRMTAPNLSQKSQGS